MSPAGRTTPRSSGLVVVRAGWHTECLAVKRVAKLMHQGWTPPANETRARTIVTCPGIGGRERKVDAMRRTRRCIPDMGVLISIWLMAMLATIAIAGS